MHKRNTNTTGHETMPCGCHLLGWPTNNNHNAMSKLKKAHEMMCESYRKIRTEAREENYRREKANAAIGYGRQEQILRMETELCGGDEAKAAYNLGLIAHPRYW